MNTSSIVLMVGGLIMMFKGYEWIDMESIIFGAALFVCGVIYAI